MEIKVNQGIKPILKVKELGICKCGGKLHFNGFFEYNFKTYYNKPDFTCDKCSFRFNCGWPEAHSIKMPRLIKLVDSAY